MSGALPGGVFVLALKEGLPAYTNRHGHTEAANLTRPAYTGTASPPSAKRSGGPGGRGASSPQASVATDSHELSNTWESVHAPGLNRANERS